MKGIFGHTLLICGLIFSPLSFSGCPFTNMTDVPGHWQGMNYEGVAVGEVIFRIQNTNPNEFNGVASITTGKCTSGFCDLLDEFIIGADFPFSGTCNEKGELSSAVLNNETADWVNGKSFGGTLPFDIHFQATMNY